MDEAAVLYALKEFMGIKGILRTFEGILRVLNPGHKNSKLEKI